MSKAMLCKTNISEWVVSYVILKFKILFSWKTKDCDDLVTIDKFVSSNLMPVFESQHQQMKKLEFSDFSSLLSPVHFEPALKRSLEGFSKINREADSSGNKKEPGRFGRFVLYKKLTKSRSLN